MKWWEHIMSWLHFGRHAEHAGRDRLHAVLAQSEAANRKVVSAAGSVVQAAERQQREIAAERERIRLRTEEQARKARARQSEQRSLVEEFLHRTGQIQPRGQRGDLQ